MRHAAFHWAIFRLHWFNLELKKVLKVEHCSRIREGGEGDEREGEMKAASLPAQPLCLFDSCHSLSVRRRTRTGAHTQFLSHSFVNSN